MSPFWALKLGPCGQVDWTQYQKIWGSFSTTGHVLKFQVSFVYCTASAYPAEMGTSFKNNRVRGLSRVVKLLLCAYYHYYYYYFIYLNSLLLLLLLLLEKLRQPITITITITSPTITITFPTITITSPFYYITVEPNKHNTNRL